MCIVYFQSFPYFCQYSIGGIEKVFSTGIILRSEPLSFHDSPKRLSNVQVWRIRRNVEKKKSSFFPDRSSFSDLCVSMYACIIQYNKRFFINFERILLKKVDHFPCINGFMCAETFKVIMATDHSKDIQPFRSFGGYIYIFSKELPTIWNVAFGANMRFITIIKIDLCPGIKDFKFLQLFSFIRIKLRRGDAPWTFSYTSISCANADKKRLNVRSLASLPEEFCQASLAKRTLCLSDSMALRTASSSEQSIMGLRPCPARVCSPLKPSDSKRFTQPLTLWAVISVCSPIWMELKPSDLSNTARQRMRKQWLSPKRKPRISSLRSDSDNVNILSFIRIYSLLNTKIRQFYYM